MTILPTFDLAAQRAALPALSAHHAVTIRARRVNRDLVDVLDLRGAEPIEHPLPPDTTALVLLREGHPDHPGALEVALDELQPVGPLHCRVDPRGQLELASGDAVYAKLFARWASPSDWPEGLRLARVSLVERLGELLAADRGSLVALRLFGRPDLVDLEFLRGLMGLRHLELRNFTQVTHVGPLASLTNLASLRLSGFERLNDLRPLAALSNLTKLDFVKIGDCLHEVHELAPLSSLTKLRSLSVLASLPGTSLAWLAPLVQLTQLSLSQSRDVTDYGAIASLTQLAQLSLQSCWKLTDLTPIARLPLLHTLVLESCFELSDLLPLARPVELRELTLRLTKRVSDVTPLAALTALERLDLGRGAAIVDVAPLAGLARLRDLDLAHCPALTRVAPLAGCVALERLDLHGSPNVRDVEALRDVPRLRELVLDRPAQHDAVMLAIALRRGDADLLARARAMTESLNASEAPRLHVGRVLQAAARLAETAPAGEIQSLLEAAAKALAARAGEPELAVPA